MSHGPLSLSSLGRWVLAKAAAFRASLSVAETSPGAHALTQPPGQDIARVIIHHGQEVLPAPAGDLQVGAVCLPELANRRSRLIESVCHLHHGPGRSGDQIMLFEDAVDSGFRDEVAVFVSKADSQLSLGELGQIQRPLDKGLANILWHLVSDGWGHSLPVFQRLNPAGRVPVVPVVKRGFWNAQRHQRSFDA